MTTKPKTAPTVRQPPWKADDRHRQVLVVSIDRERFAQRAEGDTRIPVALSSDRPIRMWWGQEVLVHTKAAIDWTYAQNGLPLLLDHDVRQQIGWLEDLTCDDDGVFRAMASKNSNPVGDWVFRDMETDGGKKRPYISIGFEPLEYHMVSADESGETWEIDRWMPMEASSVAIPADVTVGVNRAAELAATRSLQPAAAAQPAKGRKMEEDEGGGTAVATAAAVTQRNKELTEITRLAVQHSATDQLPSWMERGLSRDQVAHEILSRQRESLTPTPTPAGDLDLSERDKKQYSLGRAILAEASKDWSLAPFEREGAVRHARVGDRPDGRHQR